ncbi:MAG: nucleotidyltransferase [Balneolaceae bacterium]|nr:MAG: nucleotidyltransferase [Balneolaceae bacterium]
MNPTLVILAAGIGSRYGGLKQVDPLGPSGETIIDYSVYDALHAGFDKFVFIIRRDIEQDFLERYSHRFLDRIHHELVFQEVDMLPPGFSCPETRIKPWGTGHALWAARNAVSEPFVVINADDFYGAGAYKALADHIEKHPRQLSENYAMCGYRLDQTLSDYGSVTRGICKINAEGFLESVDEQFHIEKDSSGRILSSGGDVAEILDPGLTVSMNIWAFNPSIFEIIEKKFTMFLRSYLHHLKEEIYIPRLVDEMIRDGECSVKVLQAGSEWFGVTNPEDRQLVKERLEELIRKDSYPKSLWE